MTEGGLPMQGVVKSVVAGLAGSLAAVALVAALGWLPEATAAPAEPNALEITWYTIDAGGAQTMAGDALTLMGTAGQPDAGKATGGNYTVWSGFWGWTLPPFVIDLPVIFKSP